MKQCYCDFKKTAWTIFSITRSNYESWKKYLYYYCRSMQNI